MRQETPDKNHPLTPVIWMIVRGDLEERWAHPQPGRPDKIALLALNSTIFCLLLLSVSENVGQREAVDVLLKGRFTPPPGQSQLLTHWLDVEFTPILRGKAWNFIRPLYSAFLISLWAQTHATWLFASASAIIITLKLRGHMSRCSCSFLKPTIPTVEKNTNQNNTRSSVLDTLQVVFSNLIRKDDQVL